MMVLFLLFHMPQGNICSVDTVAVKENCDSYSGIATQMYLVYSESHLSSL